MKIGNGSRDPFPILAVRRIGKIKIPSSTGGDDEMSILYQME